MRTILALVLSLALSIGASPKAPASKYKHAYIQRSCAPWDGPALALYFTKKKSACGNYLEPSLNISLYRDLPTGPKTIRLLTHGDADFANRCLKPNGCEPATAGTLILDRFEDGKGAAGRFELRFKDGAVEAGEFDATWCDVRMRCG